jgi:hypothetical protein
MMKDLTPRDMEKLILGYEDLEPAEKVVVDGFMASHPELANRLKWHQQLEAQAGSDLPLGQAPWQDNLTSEEVEAQQESLRRILAELDQALSDSTGGAPGAKILSFTEHLRRQVLWVLPLAAVLALAVLMPRGNAEKTILHDLNVNRIELRVDGSRGADLPNPEDGVLHTGQAFALEFSLDSNAYVVVYHVDPAGQVSRVYPGTITDSLSPHRGGQGHQIPDPDSGEVWILGSETGTESFLVASSKELPLGLQEFKLPTDTSDRARVLAELKSRLAAIVDQVDLYEFEHVD